MSIAVLLTGGTIGQRVAAGGSVPDGGSTARLVVDAARAADVRVTTVPVMQRNSPDMTPADWDALVLAVLDALDSGAAGVVVLHGTDTAAYAAAALRLALGTQVPPVVLTGSMLPADAAASDAPGNLVAALRVARSGRPGVKVVFGSEEPGVDAVVLDPLTVLKVRTGGTAAFTSTGPLLGRVVEGQVVLEDREQPSSPSDSRRHVSCFARDVDLVKVTPMTTGARLARSLEGLRGVVVEGYGAGHVSAAQLEALRPFCGPVVVTTQVLGDRERLGCYASDRELLELPHVVPAGPATSVAALVTLSWALGSGLEVAELLGRLREEP